MKRVNKLDRLFDNWHQIEVNQLVTILKDFTDELPRMDSELHVLHKEV